MVCARLCASSGGVSTCEESKGGYEDFKLEKRPTDKAKEPDPGGCDQQNLGYKQLF